MEGVVQNEELKLRAVRAREHAARVQIDSRRLRALTQAVRGARRGCMSLVRCAWCGSLKLEEEWLELAAIGAGRQQVGPSLRRRATHGICPPCFEREQDGAERARANRPNG